MKKVLFLSFLSTLCINGMETVKSPADVIRGHMDDPSKVLAQLKNFESGDLKKYRDSGHNNLIHIAVKELGLPRQDENGPQGIDPLIQYLVNSGVDISEVNDFRELPLYLAHLAEREPYYLECLLEGLGARPIYFSLAPEIRTIKRWARYFCSCEYFRKRKKD